MDHPQVWDIFRGDHLHRRHHWAGLRRSKVLMLQECAKHPLHVCAQIVVKHKVDTTLGDQGSVILVQIMRHKNLWYQPVMGEHVQDRPVPATHRIDRAEVIKLINHASQNFGRFIVNAATAAA